MAERTTVLRRRKDPGNIAIPEESPVPTGATVEAQAVSYQRFTSKIRAEFAVEGRIGKFNAVEETKKVFSHMMLADPDIVFKSDKDGSITFRKTSDFPSGETKFKEFFTVTPHTRNDGSGRIHVNFQIESKNRLAVMKRDSSFFGFLRESKIYLSEHKYETHALQSIGFIAKKSPVLTNRPQFEEDIGKALNEYMKCAVDEGAEAGVVIDGREFTPALEIVSKNVVHVTREGEKKTGVITTQALEIRCEKSNAYQLSKLLCAANLPDNKFGKFVPYGMAKSETDVYKNMIKAHNKHCGDMVVIPVFGLHRDVLNTIVEPVDEKGDSDILMTMLEEAGNFEEGKEGGSVRADYIFTAIESTQRSDDLGKWFFLTTKSNENTANEIIDSFLIPRAMDTIAYKDHLNDSDSFQQGIRRTNKANRSFTNYAAALRENMIPDDPKEDKQQKQNNIKKRRQILIEFGDSQEFPELPKTKATTNRRQSKSKEAGETPKDQHISSTGSITSTTQCTNTSEFDAFKNSVQAQIDMLKLQLVEMEKQSDAWQKKCQEDQDKREASYQANQQELVAIMKKQLDQQNAQHATMQQHLDKQSAQQDAKMKQQFEFLNASAKLHDDRMTRLEKVVHDLATSYRGPRKRVVSEVSTTKKPNTATQMELTEEEEMILAQCYTQEDEKEVAEATPSREENE